MPSLGVKIGAVALLATGLHACVRERTFHHHPHMKRQATAPTPLTEEEAVLYNYFDSSSIEDWAYVCIAPALF